MMFWDSSAILPLCLEEPKSKTVRDLAKKDGAMVTWWASRVECSSAFARLGRENRLTPDQENQMKRALKMLFDSWTEIAPIEEVRDMAERLLYLHPLHAADSLQLAAALVWAGKNPKDLPFVCLDQRLGKAVRKEGFTVFPS